MVALCFGLGVVAASGTASAQTAQYQTFIVGERALGMGGAFTGLADDASAAFYNPAGLARLQSGALSGSLQVNAFHRQVVENGYGSPIGQADLVHDATPTFPVFVGVVYKIGKRDEDGVRNHALALCTFHPYRRDYRYTVDLFNRSTGVSDALRITGSDTITWYGPSYAIRLSPRFALGISGFLSTRSMRHEEDQSIVTEGQRDSVTGIYQNLSLSVRESLVEVEAEHLVARLGMHYAIDDHFSVGVMLQPPGLAIHQASRVRERRSFADLFSMPPSATFFHDDQGDLPAESPIPWEVRLGAAYRADDNFSVAMDLSVYGPNGTAKQPIAAIGVPDPDPETGDIMQPGDFVVQSWHRELTANLSVGIETLIADTVPLRAGLFTNFSAAPAIEGPTNQYAPNDVDTFGTTLSVGLRSGDYDIALGAAAMYGQGDALRINPDPFGPVADTYLPTTAESRTIYFFLSGAKRAVSRLGRNVYDEYLRPE